MQSEGYRFESVLLHVSENMSEDKLAELTRARKPATQKELTKKARKYILEKAEEANGKPLDIKEDEE